ncbi:MAG: hypothetical protein Q8S57_10480 [Methanoregula sp.]|nr:hypothetical protein [Methanoregula sp.]
MFLLAARVQIDRTHADEHRIWYCMYPPTYTNPNPPAILPHNSPVRMIALTPASRSIQSALTSPQTCGERLQEIEDEVGEGH